MIKKFYSSAATASATVSLAEKRQVAVVCSSENVDRSGDVVVQTGIDLTQYRRNPIVLWQHNPSMPIARCIDIGLQNGHLEALLQFPPAGEIQRSDEVYALLRNGIVNCVSIGFAPVSSVPLDKGNPQKGPQKYDQTRLLEISFVSVPANADAAVIGRAHGDADAARAKRLREIEMLGLAQLVETRTTQQIRTAELTEFGRVGDRFASDQKAEEHAELVAKRERFRADLRRHGRLV